MLALNDYSGQGTALVGLLDVFFEEKGYINADEFRRFCSPTVPLARIPKFVYTNDETFHPISEQPLCKEPKRYTASRMNMAKYTLTAL